MLSIFNRSEGGTEMVIGTADGTPLARIPWSIRQRARYFWTRLQVHSDELPHSIGVTSQLSGEGVSMTSMALAAVLGRTGETCLVEANWWGTGIPVPEGHGGLAAVLQGEASITDMLLPTSHPGFSILPAGDLDDPTQAVMARSEAMSSVIGALHQRFEFVILDLPSIKTSATALSFAAAADASILVVRQRSTRIDEVESAVRDLRHTRLLGVILNDNRLSMPKYLQRRLLDA